MDGSRLDSDLQDMLTFIGSLVPSEYSLHLLLFQSLMSFAAYKLWYSCKPLLRCRQRSSIASSYESPPPIPISTSI